MKRRDFCKALVCSAALAPGLALPRAEAAAKSQTVGRAVPAGNYTMSFRSELSQMDIEHEYYYSDSFFAHSSIQYDHQLALATLGMVTAAFNTWASDAKYWVNGDVGREDSLDAAYTKLGFADVKYRYYDVDVGRAGDFVGWSTARKTITLNGKRTTIVALILRGGGYGGEWVSNLHTGAGHAHSGFIIPVHEVFADLKNYLAAAQQKGELGVVKLWMGGYSRGAAVANLLAARVNRELSGLERENVFVYTFATPVALGPQDYPDLQQDYDNNHNADGSLKESWGESNIFNIISSGDIVPHLLPEEWGFHRNGNDRFLPSTRNEEELEDLNDYRNRIMLIKELLKTPRLATVDLCVHINISEASYYRYINFTSYMKADIFIHACLFLKQYIESNHIPYTQEEKRLIKTLDLFQISSNSNLNCN